MRPSRKSSRKTISQLMQGTQGHENVTRQSVLFNGTHKKCPAIKARRSSGKSCRHCQTISQLTQGSQGREKVSRQSVPFSGTHKNVPQLSPDVPQGKVADIAKLLTRNTRGRKSVP